MTKTFERFLRSLSDEDLLRFAEERRAVEPPYWRVMRVALAIETGRRGLEVDPPGLGPTASGRTRARGLAIRA